MPVPALPLSLAGAGAFAVNLTCALMPTRYRQHEGSLTRAAAFLSARNDVSANVAIVGAGLITAWPDLVVGLGIALMNADSAREVFSRAGGTPHSPAVT